MVKIKLGDIEVNEISNSSGLFSGDNLQIQWKAFISTIDGYGSLDGNYNNSQDIKSIVIKKNDKKADK